MVARRLGLLVFLLSFLSVSASAESKFVRWTGADDKNADLSHVLWKIKKETGYSLDESDFVTIENLPLANNHFRMLAQVASGTPIKGMSIRLWTDKKTGQAIQVEAKVENPVKIDAVTKHFGLLHSVGLLTGEDRALEIARAHLKTVDYEGSDDVQRLTLRDASNQWSDGELVRVFKFRGKRGTHLISVGLGKGLVVDSRYQEFPQAELSVKAQVFPIYEEAEGAPGQQLPRIPATLKYIKTMVGRTAIDPYAALRAQRYTWDMYDSVLGMTPEGRAKGYWSMAYIKEQAALIRAGLPLVPNTFAGGLILEGRYATINLHPAAKSKFTGLDFTPAISSQLKPEWITSVIDGKEVDEMVPQGSLLHKPLYSADEAWNRPARRLPDHDPVSYINDGFDELQVYYAINTLFTSLKAGGFTDPELSTRPFNAYLFDPEIAMRDNAYYTDDTINFTTYSPDQPNYARDNATIWHELGHGVMDRLMGDSIQLADTGGLSEGMADFVADLVVVDKSKNQPFPGSDKFRIQNNTGFNLTNEVHDDGEAYGGALHDLLVAAIARDGLALGRKKVSDLTLEAMRFSRNHPGLTANDWFDRMLFADSLGNGSLRAPGDLKDLIVAAVQARNFSLDGGPVASFSLKQGAKLDEVDPGTPGSRQRPIPVLIKESEEASFPIQVALQNSAHYQFKFPVQVRVSFTGGPLQGAIHWQGEEQSPKVYTINSEAELLKFDVKIAGKCDSINRDDGSCVDFAYIQIWNDGETRKPNAKKRFYLRLKTSS